MSGFVRVAPLCRTPVGIEAFDYAVPDGCSFAPGDLLRVPLRASRVEAVVLETLTHSPFAEKARLLPPDPPLTRLGGEWVQLLRWVSARTFQSGPSVAKAWLRLLPKKLAPWTTLVPKRGPRGMLATHWLAHPEQALIEHVRTLPKGTRVLIITPYTTQAERIAERLQAPALLSDDPKTAAAHTWREFTEGTSPLLVSTRVGAWLGLYAEEVFLLEPENDEHKQDELSPRFDARLLVAWLYQRVGVALTTFGRTPPLHVHERAPAIDLHPQLLIRHSRGRSAIPGIDWQALETFLDGDPTIPRLIIHPIRGMRARVQCRECGEVIACPVCRSALRRRERDGWCDVCAHAHLLPETCPRCQGTAFSGSAAGIDLLQQRWQAAELPPVLWRDGSPVAIDQPLAQHARVLVTQPALLGGAAEDVRRNERLCRAYRTLASRVQEAEGELYLQVNETDAERWLHWLTPQGVEALLLQERQDRYTFRYPPSVRLVKLLVNDLPERLQASVKTLSEAMRQAPEFLECRGPFLVEGRPASRPRSVIHLLFQPSVQEETLLTLLHPFAKRAVIDLDPIAFLR